MRQLILNGGSVNVKTNEDLDFFFGDKNEDLDVTRVFVPVDIYISL